MSTGTIIYYSGFGLLAITVLLAIVFAVKKPKYIPEHASTVGADDETLRLRNGDSMEWGENQTEKSGTLPDVNNMQASQQMDSGITETMTMTELMPVDETVTMVTDETELVTERC